MAEYAFLSQYVQEKFFDLLMETTNFEKAKNSVIDIGCGTGNNTIKLLPLIGSQSRVVGIDPIRERIEIARKVLDTGKTNNHRLAFKQGSGLDVGNFGNDFDLAITATVLNWIRPEDKIPTFKAIYDSLRTGGEYIFNTVHIENNSQGFLAFFKSKTRREFYKHYFPSTKMQLKRNLQDAGFSNITIQEIEIILPLPINLDQYFQWIASSLHVFDYETILSELRTSNTNRNTILDQDGKVIYKWTHFYGRCVKD